MSDCPPQPHSNGTPASAGTDLPGGLILMPQHLADLRKSGLSDETIRAGGFFTTYGHRARELLAWDDKKDSLGHCLAIPYRDAEGNTFPALGADGEPVVSSDG